MGLNMSIKFCMVLRSKLSPFLMITIINLYEIAIKPEINKEKQRNLFQSDNYRSWIRAKILWINIIAVSLYRDK